MKVLKIWKQFSNASHEQKTIVKVYMVLSNVKQVNAPINSKSRKDKKVGER